MSFTTRYSSDMSMSERHRNAAMILGSRSAAAHAAFLAIDAPRVVPVDTRADHGPITAGQHAAAGAYAVASLETAAANGHELEAFRGRTRSMLTSARCTSCHASAGIMLDGSAIPSSSIGQPCRATLGRYIAGKCGRMHYVTDTLNPGGEPVAAFSSKAAAAKRARELNAPAVAPAAPVSVDDHAAAVTAATAKVTRARKALAKAVAALEILEPGSVELEPAAPVAAAAAPAVPVAGRELAWADPDRYDFPAPTAGPVLTISPAVRLTPAPTVEQWAAACHAATRPLARARGEHRAIVARIPRFAAA